MKSTKDAAVRRAELDAPYIAAARRLVDRTQGDMRRIVARHERVERGERQHVERIKSFGRRFVAATGNDQDDLFRELFLLLEAVDRRATRLIFVLSVQRLAARIENERISAGEIVPTKASLDAARELSACSKRMSRTTAEYQHYMAELCRHVERRAPAFSEWMDQELARLRASVAEHERALARTASEELRRAS